MASALGFAGRRSQTRSRRRLGIIEHGGSIFPGDALRWLWRPAWKFPDPLTKDNLAGDDALVGFALDEKGEGRDGPSCGFRGWVDKESFRER